MKRAGLIALLTVMFLIITGCNNNNTNGQDATELNNGNNDETDMETLVETNRQLVSQLEKELEEKDGLRDRIQALEEENRQLKDDILTYKQQAIEIENNYERELSIREDLDRISREFFQYMNEMNHSELEELTGENIKVDDNINTLVISEDDGTERNFHYLKLDSIVYIRQSTFTLDHGSEEFTTVYEFYTGEEDSFLYDGGVELVYALEEGDWIITSVRYVP